MCLLAEVSGSDSGCQVFAGVAGMRAGLEGLRVIRASCAPLNKLLNSSTIGVRPQRCR